MAPLWLTRLVVLLAPAGALAAAPVANVVGAMEAVGAFDLATPYGHPQMFDLRTSLGVISPQVGSTMALLSTGDVDTITKHEDFDCPADSLDTSASDRATLQFSITAPPWAQTFGLRWYFLTREYPEYIGNIFLDTFEVLVESPTYSAQAAYDFLGNPINPSSAVMTVTDPASLAGTGFDQHGGSGGLTLVVPCAPDETIDLYIQIYDASDGIYDSAVLLDGFVWSSAAWPSPVSSSDDGDGDGFVDPIDCDAQDPQTYPGAHEFCDGLDNDCDTAVDDGCSDDDEPDDDDATDDDDDGSPIEESCSDGEDDDGDGLVDCDDPDCVESPACTGDDDDSVDTIDDETGAGCSPNACSTAAGAGAGPLALVLLGWRRRRTSAGGRLPLPARPVPPPPP